MIGMELSKGPARGAGCRRCLVPAIARCAILLLGVSPGVGRGAGAPTASPRGWGVGMHGALAHPCGPPARAERGGSAFCLSPRLRASQTFPLVGRGGGRERLLPVPAAGAGAPSACPRGWGEEHKGARRRAAPGAARHGIRMSEEEFLRLRRVGDTFELVTAEVRLREVAAEPAVAGAVAGGGGGDAGGGTGMQLDLLLTTHIADPEYFAGLQERLRASDRVLFEMIAPGDACELDEGGGRRLWRRPLPSPDQRALARSFGLQHQLDGLEYTREWVVADLDKETVNALQERYFVMAESQFADGVEDPVLQEAIISVGRPAVVEWFVRGGELEEVTSEWVRASLTLARACACVLPCPEISWLVLDWVKLNKGLARLDVLLAIVRRSADLDFLAARKLVYAQSLVSGQRQALAGAYRVLLRARNRAALQEVVRARGGGCRNVTLVYGVMHGRDVLESAGEMGLASEGGRGGVTWNVAWSIPDDRGFVSTFVCACVVVVFVGGGALHWADLVGWLAQSNECYWLGGRTEVVSLWPRTDILVRVTQFDQCPSEVFAWREGLATAAYLAVHLMQYFLLKRILLDR